MPPSSPPRRLLAAFVVGLMAFAGAGVVRETFRCRFDRIVRPACCCPPRALPADAARMVRPDCCDHAVFASTSDAPAPCSHVDAAPHAAPAVLALVPPKAMGAWEIAPSIVRRVEPRATTGPPLHIRHRSLLI